VMAVVTTVMTAPLLKLVYPDRLVAKEVEEAERAALGIPNAYRVMVVLDEAETDAPLASLAADFAASERPSQVVLSVFRPQAPAPLEVGSGLSIELAEMAGVMGELEALAEQIRARGIDCVVLSRFSADPTADAISQVASISADLLLISPTANIDLGRLLAGVEITVGYWDGATAIAELPGPVAALARSGDEAEAAIALALRLSAVRGEELALIDDGSRRRVSGYIDRLERFGVTVAVISPEQLTGGIVLVDVEAEAPPGAPGVLRVRPNQVQDQSDLAKLIESDTVIHAAAPTA
jgi:hypothetical protein